MGGTPGARGPVAECRLRRLDDGLYEYSPKKGAAFTVTAAALVRRLVALLPPARRHLTSFHGAYAPNAHLRAVITQPLPQPTTSSSRKTGAAPKPKRPRLDWAQLHQRTFGIDVLLCPCGGRRSIRRLHSPAARRRHASSSSASRFPQACFRPPRLHRNCSSRCDGHRTLQSDRRRRSPRVPPTRQSPARLSTTGGPRPSSSHLPLSIGERRAPHPAPGSAV